MKNILITGADGYLGRRLALYFLNQTGYRLHLWMRANNQDEFESKKNRLNQIIPDVDKRCQLYYGNLTNENPFDAVDLKELDSLIHSAAVTDFNVPRDKALQVNVEGTKKALEFAGRFTSLKQFVLISSVYAAGLKKGLVKEEILKDQEGFSNHYEWSKWASEDLLVKSFQNIPWKIIRVATIICDREDGCVEQQNAFHNTLKLFYYGLLSLMPGNPDTTIYFVTGDYTVSTIGSILGKGELKKVYQVVHPKAESITLGQLVDIAFDVFSQNEDFKLRRIMKPLFTDTEAFNLLEQGIHSFSSGIVNQAISSVSPFARQLFYEKEFESRNTKSVLSDARVWDFKKIVKNTCEYLVKTKWGRMAAHHVE